jgi:hypothetical protein
LGTGARIEVRSGSPTPEDIAALVLALDHVTVADAAVRRRAPRAPAWVRAARREAMGSAPMASPADLRR